MSQTGYLIAAFAVVVLVLAAWVVIMGLKVMRILGAERGDADQPGGADG